MVQGGGCGGTDAELGCHDARGVAVEAVEHGGREQDGARRVGDDGDGDGVDPAHDLAGCEARAEAAHGGEGARVAAAQHGGVGRPVEGAVGEEAEVAHGAGLAELGHGDAVDEEGRAVRDAAGERARALGRLHGQAQVAAPVHEVCEELVRAVVAVDEERDVVDEGRSDDVGLAHAHGEAARHAPVLERRGGEGVQERRQRV